MSSELLDFLDKENVDKIQKIKYLPFLILLVLIGFKVLAENDIFTVIASTLAIMHHG